MVIYSTMPSVGRIAVLATTFLGAANAHMFMREPKPYEGYADKAPLDASGSNFPCQGAPLKAGGQELTAGGSFDFKLEDGSGQNTAVHGGGSCQLSITYETDPEKAKDPKNWQVIYSIEGGCPANAAANLDAGYSICESDGESECLHTWNIPVPKGVKSGDAVLAWTWQNTLGNREFYMNCAGVTIDGGSGDEQFPPMFVANVAVDGGVCDTTASADVLYPSPGKYVTTMSATDGGKNWPKATPTGQACGGSGGGSSDAKPTDSYGNGSGSGSSGSEESAPAVTSAPGYSAPANSAPAYGASSQVENSYTQQKGKQPATTFATSASTAAAVASSAPASSAPASYAAPAPSGYSSTTSSESSESNSTASGDCQPCDEDGALICIGDDSFGICDHSCAVPRALAAGTVCTDGVIGSAQKNRFARRHAHFGSHKH